MVQVFPFSGFVNTDDPNEVIPPTHISACRNIWWKGTEPNMRAENIPGTREKTNPFLTNDGNNLTIGRYYDAVNQRIFFFNYRGDNKKAIYMYDTVNAVYYILVEEGINADNDALQFTDIGIIRNVDIIYGDSQQGDILCFIDSQGVPKKVNIQRAINGGYGTIKKTYLDIAKEPASIPPTVVYEPDPVNTVNNLRKKLFKFKIRWVFDDQDKSVTSSQSEIPIPGGAFDQQIDSDPTKNCRIAICYQTGPANVKKIEILAAVSLGDQFSDYFLITSLDKSVEGLLNNDFSTYLFYNNAGYNYIDVAESVQLFDYVPQTAQSQTLLNGNVLAYGNIKEGYPNLTNFNNGTTTSYIDQTSRIPYFYTSYFVKLITMQDGDSGFGSGDIHISVRGVVPVPDIFFNITYYVFLTDGSNISYTTAAGDQVSDIVNGLRNDAVSKGYTIISVTNNDLYVFKTGMSLARNIISDPLHFQENAFINTSLMAYDWSSKDGFGLVYFDEKGRTDGTVYTNGFSIEGIPFQEADQSTPYIPYLIGYIYHRPPSWAKYFQWVRTKDLSKSKMQQWISDRTFKDLVIITGQIKNAYISIESLNAFVAAHPGSPLGYTFTAGDRIKFMKRYNPDGTTANIYGNSKDYEIVGSLTNPIINGEVKSGQFIKIILPATDGNFDFGDGFFNYFIELYTPTQSVANNLNVYYEFGERYTIANANTNNAFHQGYLQNQSSDLSVPAIYEFVRGDYYNRLRGVQVGNVFTFNIPAANITGASVILMGITFISQTYSDSNITTHSVAYVGQPVFDPTTDGRWFLGANLTTTFHVQGTIILSFPVSLTGNTWNIYLQNRFGDKLYLVNTFDASNAGVYSFVVDTYITLGDDHIFLLALGSSSREINFMTTNLTFTIDKVFSQRMNDQNFSDYFPSKVNSNGRAFVYDQNANQVTFPVLYRWSLAYQSDTNINQSNRFYFQNSDEVDRGFGAIMAMKVWDRILTFFQERKCGQTGVYQKFITDTAGNSQLITTTDIITSNNVSYYAGNFGCGNQPDSIVQSGYVYYFVDPIKGKQLRLSKDGIVDLSELYKTQTWAGKNIPKYLTSYNYTFGGRARITGTFNIRKDNTGEYLCVLQPGFLGDATLVGETFSFDERNNAFRGWYDFAPEQILCAENVLYSWVNGKMYIHDDENQYCTFYGVYHDPTITKVFNGSLIEKKSWMSLTEISSTVWDCPEITTNQMSYGNVPQQSNLITQDFVQLESTFNASFLGDIYSIGGISDGDSLKGNLIIIKFRAPNATSLVSLSAINLYYIDSPFTNR